MRPVALTQATGGCVMSERETRLAANEVAFREVNEELAGRVEEVAGAHATFGVLCECSNQSCVEGITVTPTEYEAVHADPALFIVVPGHANRDIEDVVGETERYEIVRKRGDAAEVARRVAT
jgi:hypothetical protein